MTPRRYAMLGFLVAVAAFSIVWSRPRQIEAPPAVSMTLPPSVPATPTKIAPAPSPRAIAYVDEPILVLPDAEVIPAPEPALIPDLNVATGRTGYLPLSSPIKPAARPETALGERPWMPYAAEDQELSNRRRLEWAKVAIDESPTASRRGTFEETEEPPLLKD